MKHSKILLFLIAVFGLNSCKYHDKMSSKVDVKNSDNIKIVDAKQFAGTWFLVKKKHNGEFISCNDISNSIIVSNSTIFYKTPMEDSDFTIDHVKESNGTAYLYLDKKELSYFRFKWIDKENGISEWTLNNYQSDIYVNQAKLDKLKKSTCEAESPIIGVSCNLSKISSKFNFKIFGTDFENKGEDLKPLIAKIIIVQKNDSSVKQEIRFEPNSWITYDNVPCNAISYYKIEMSANESIENHHDFIVADYNFDGLEDFAYIWDVGGNGGVLYAYFFQNKQGEFYEIDSFPLQHRPFPSVINVEKKILTTTSIIGCCKISKNTYQLKDNQWKVIQTEQEDLM